MPSCVEVVHSHPSARARDFVDIRVVVEEFSVDVEHPDFRSILKKTFAAKKAPLSLLGEIERYREYHRTDFKAVEDTVKANVVLEPFDSYFDYVVDRCQKLESLWNK